MTVVTTLDIDGLTAAEYRPVMDELGVDERAEPDIYLPLTTPIESGFRIVEIWDHNEGFDLRRSTSGTGGRGGRCSAGDGHYGEASAQLLWPAPGRAARLGQLPARSTRHGGAHVSRSLERREIP
jgi:hypothetical protein